MTQAQGLTSLFTLDISDPNVLTYLAGISIVAFMMFYKD